MAATAIFLFTPSLVRAVYSAATPGSEIDALKQHYRRLDSAESNLPKAQQELSVRRRVAISAWLAMRGLAVDPGLRDEGVEHASFFPRIYGLTRWEWTDMFRYWQSPNNRKDPTQLTSESL